MEKLKDILRNNRMSTRPEYYSGRGAILCDLDSKILEGIYQGILKEFGKNAAKNFLKMVADIKVLSATTFLEELYQLYFNEWKYTKKEKHADGISVPKNEDGDYDESSMVSGMMGIFSVMGNNRDETEMIRGNFLYNHGVKPKAGYYETDECGNCIRFMRNHGAG